MTEMTSMNSHTGPDTNATGTAQAAAGRTCILVAGMHRSGTSALTRILNLLGAALPANLMPASAEFNASGFWESEDVVAQDEAVLRALGARWNDVLALDLDELSSADRAAFQDGLARLCEAQFRDTPLFVVKDPRFARLLGLWLPALRELGIEPKLVLPYRHPLEVAGSLARRDGFSIDTSVQLWLGHMLDALAHADSVAWTAIGYPELLADWRSCALKMSRALGLAWPRPVAQAQAEIDLFLRPELRHHVVAETAPAAPALALALELFAALDSSDEAARAAAVTLRPRFDALQAGALPLLRDLRRERKKEGAALAALRAEFDVKCRHVEQLDTTLREERATYRHLEQEFEAKCTHVKLLLTEVEALRRAPPEGALDSGLAEIETLLRRRQDSLRERRERDERALHQCRIEIARAEAQLDMLKNLFLDH